MQYIHLDSPLAPTIKTESFGFIIECLSKCSDWFPRIKNSPNKTTIFFMFWLISHSMIPPESERESQNNGHEEDAHRNHQASEILFHDCDALPTCLNRSGIQTLTTAIIEEV